MRACRQDGGRGARANSTPSSGCGRRTSSATCIPRASSPCRRCLNEHTQGCTGHKPCLVKCVLQCAEVAEGFEQQGILSCATMAVVTVQLSSMKKMWNNVGAVARRFRCQSARLVLLTLALVAVLLGQPEEGFWRGGSDLHREAHWGNTQAVNVLLESGADHRALDWDDRTPLYFARTEEVARALLMSGADPNALDSLRVPDMGSALPDGRAAVRH